MESKHWTGDDEREFSTPPSEEACKICGVGPLEECLPDCDCNHCPFHRAKVTACGF